jgi:DNA-binding transcriptional ArsR family regulator
VDHDRAAFAGRRSFQGGSSERRKVDQQEGAAEAMSTVSQQLRMLRNENLVRRRRVAKHIFYALADEHVTGLIRDALDHALEPAEEDDEG